MVIPVEHIIDTALLLAGESPRRCLYRQGDETDATLRRRLRASVLPAAARLLEEAPETVFDTWSFIDDESLRVDETGKGSVALPHDFLRLLSFRMSDWQRSVTVPLTASHPLEARLASPWRGVAATTRSPVCMIRTVGSGRELWFAGCRSAAATMLYGLYIPSPAIDTEGCIDIPEPLLLPLAARIAGGTPKPNN